MVGNEIKHGRVHDADGARRAILNAAEEIFALHGYSGARVDEIAAQAGYNKSLLFQYYGDKLRLYTEVLKRADQETTEIRAQVLSPLFTDESIATDSRRFKAFLENMVRVNFDYLVAHPRILRILLWEMADGWQTYSKISPQFAQDDLIPFNRVCNKALQAGLLHSNFTPLIQFTITQPICQVFLAYLPVYQISLADEDITSPTALARAREFIVDLIISGIFKDPEGRSPNQGWNNAD